MSETIYKMMYLYLFNRVTDAIEAIREADLSKGLELLTEAQKYCEEMYIEQG